MSLFFLANVSAKSRIGKSVNFIITRYIMHNKMCIIYYV